MKTKWIIKLLVLFILVVSSVSCSNERTNELEGKVKREIISIAPKVPGRILEIRVKESDVVKAGDTLAIIDVPEVEAKMMQAKGILLAASSQHQMAKNGATKEEREQILAIYNAAMEQYNFAKKSYDRISAMFKDSLVSAQVYDETYAKFNGAKSQLDAARAKKEEVLGGVRNEKILMAEGQQNQAEGAVKEAQVAYSERYILAPRDMTIETIALHTGELALPGYNIFVGYDLKSPSFRFTVPESKVNVFKKNKSYHINLPFASKQLTAKLVSIKELARYATKTSSYPNYQLGESVYELKLIPENISDVDSLYDNFTAILEY